MKSFRKIIEKMIDDEHSFSDSGSSSNNSVVPDNGKINKAWKVCVLLLLAAGVGLGCCDLDCVLAHLNSLLGL